MPNNQEILQDMRHVAQFLKNEALTQNEYEENGQFGLSTVRVHFGRWNQAKIKAGLKPNGNVILSRRMLDDDVLLKEIIRLTNQLSKEPTEAELSAFGKYSPQPYRKRWGSFIKAKEVAYQKFGLAISGK